jgi:hypothetical protein
LCLDDEMIARIPQDGSADRPFIVNPYNNAKSGTWQGGCRDPQP